MRSEAQYLDDLLDSSQQIMELIAGFDAATFQADRRTRSAVLHELTVVGEAVNKLSGGLRDRYPDVPWSLIVGTRNVIVHGYFDLLWERIWRTCTHDIPVLIRRAAEIREIEFPANST
jgi:uncharacterized protein with HEPN domain